MAEQNNKPFDMDKWAAVTKEVFEIFDKHNLYIEEIMFLLAGWYLEAKKELHRLKAKEVFNFVNKFRNLN